MCRDDGHFLLLSDSTCRLDLATLDRYLRTYPGMFSDIESGQPKFLVTFNPGGHLVRNP
jgi:hypothetical protein